MKRYEVTVLEKHSHGIYGKIKYGSWLLEGSTKDNVKEFAFDIIAGMTWEELTKEHWSPIVIDNKSDIIGHENAKNCFSVNVNLYKE